MDLMLWQEHCHLVATCQVEPHMSTNSGQARDEAEARRLLDEADARDAEARRLREQVMADNVSEHCVQQFSVCCPSQRSATRAGPTAGCGYCLSLHDVYIICSCNV